MAREKHPHVQVVGGNVDPAATRGTGTGTTDGIVQDC